MSTNIPSKTITLDPIYITVDAPAPKPQVELPAPKRREPPAGDGFDSSPTPGAKLDAFTRGAPKYTAAPELADVAQGERHLRQGQRGESVRYAQGLLSDAGFGPLEADGKLGPKTDAALRAYQKAHGLEVDGKLGKDTLRSLHAGNAASVGKMDGFAELAPDIQAELKSRYAGAATDIRHRQALASLVEDLHTLPPDLQKKALDAAATPGSNAKLLDATSDFVLGLSDAAALGRKLDAIIGPR